MAFNFRPKTSNDITGKNKPYSIQAAAVFAFVQKEYGTTIVLDPTKDFSDIKIPRIVEQTDNIKRVKEKLAKVANLQKLKIAFGNGSGEGGSSINAAETAKQENATRFVCEQFIEKGKMPPGNAIEKIYPKYDDGWAQTFQMQAEALKGFLKGKTGYEYSRDQGIMPFVEKIAIEKCGVRTKDSWNPADIYIVKKSQKDKIQKKIKSIGDMSGSKEAKLDSLNEYMRSEFISRNLIGISLKKLGKGVKLEETNVKGNKVEKIEMVKNSLRCDLDLNTKGEFNTGELAFQIKVDKALVNVQVRAFSGGVRESTQMDMTGSGAAAKLGKVSSREAIDPYLAKNQLKRRMGTDIPKVGAFTKATINEYLAEQQKLSRYRIAGMVTNFGKVKWETSFKKARELEISNNRTASQLSSKLQCFQWVNILYQLDRKKKLNEFLNVLYYGAKKQYATAGPFLKIS